MKPLEAGEAGGQLQQKPEMRPEIIGSSGRRFDHSEQIPIMVQLMNSCIASSKTKSSSNKS